MKKIITSVLVLVLTLVIVAFALSGCSSDDDGYVIGILQLFDHVALDASHDGFVGRLAEHGFIEDENVTFIFRNAAMDMSVASQMAEYLVSRNPDLILSIATGASQAVARATEDIPIVITAVTSPEGAELVDSNERPGRNVTGVSDLTPVAQQMDLITRLLPEARVIGLLYNSGEINSRIQADMARAAINSMPGFSYVTATAPTMADVADVAQSLVGRVDVIYIPTCNTIAGAYATVMLVADEAGVPVIAGEVGGVRAGALATEGIDYYLLGRQTADMAVQILRGEATPAEMPIQWQTEAGVLSINIDAAARLGIVIPDDILQTAQIITDSD